MRKKKGEKAKGYRRKRQRVYPFSSETLYDRMPTNGRKTGFGRSFSFLRFFASLHLPSLRHIRMVALLVVLCAVGGTAIFLAWENRNPAISTAGGKPPGVSAAQAILIDQKTGKVLYEKNAKTKAYPASTTKIMTALLTLETLEEYQSPIGQKVKIPAEAVGVEGSSLYLKKGEKVVLRDLLYGLMLRSGNDAAVALAILMAGNKDLFVQKMNLRAAELGCKQTHFMNPNGLYDDNHYTTAADMAIIARKAMEHAEFRKIVSSRSWEANREQKVFNHFYNKNKTLRQFKGGNGIKIGFTKASGRTLVASAKRGEKELICVVMRAPNWFKDAYTLMEYGFKRWEEAT